MVVFLALASGALALAGKLQTAEVAQEDAVSKPAEIHLRWNQVGYRPGAVKTAVAFARAPLPAQFELQAEGGRVVHRGLTQPVAGGWGRSSITPRSISRT